jgi:hypothetical protein
MAAQKQQVGAVHIAIAVVVLLIFMGFLWVRTFGPPISFGARQQPTLAPEGALPQPGDPRAYPQGMPRGMAPGGPAGSRSPG